MSIRNLIFWECEDRVMCYKNDDYTLLEETRMGIEFVSNYWVYRSL